MTDPLPDPVRDRLTYYRRYLLFAEALPVVLADLL